MMALAAVGIASAALAVTIAHGRAHQTARFAARLDAYKRRTDQHTIPTNGQGPRRP
jgi:hypothetical protein